MAKHAKHMHKRLSVSHRHDRPSSAHDHDRSVPAMDDNSLRNLHKESSRIKSLTLEWGSLSYDEDDRKGGVMWNSSVDDIVF